MKKLLPLLLLPIYLLFAPDALAQDSTGLIYPVDDREGDFLNGQDDNPFQFEDPPIIIKKVEYDAETNTYVLTETVGGQNYRPPTYMTYDEYVAYTLNQETKDYWKKRTNTQRLLTDKNVAPPFDPRFNPKEEGGIFRGLTVDIRPQGNVEVTLGGNVQKYDNPNLPVRARTQGGFDFDMNINMNVTGKIGDALELTLRYNNKTGFAFDNQFKLQYLGDEDDIIQLVEAGNVSFPLQTQLITGAQSLRGIKLQTQFGRLTMTSVLSEQQSQKQSIIIEDGAQTQTFEIKADQYEADKHFFLTQFFEQNYDDALSRVPNILSVSTIEELEVWVTNRTGQTQNVRDIVAFSDMAELNPSSNQVMALAGFTAPDNGANDLYTRLTADPTTRFVDNVNTTLQGANFNLDPIIDYEKTFARKLSSSEYTFHPQLGYLSLNTALQPNQVLGVAFKYNHNGTTFQVGELSRNVPPDSSSTTKSLFVKMLRGTSIRPDLPTWDLMMKNIYSLGAFQVSSDDFRLDIFYIDPGGGQKRFLPKGNLSDQQLIRVLELDNLNNQGDPQPDGVFDFAPGVTINPQNGRLIFPVTKPFGEHLADELIAANSAQFVDDYVFNELYDSTIFVAQQFPEKNRFLIKGRYKGSGGSRIQLGAFQLPEGSVNVSAGGTRLEENVHYTVDYNLGAVTIIDEGILNSGQQIKVDFENNALFGFQQRSLLATRLDYKISDDFNIGGTIMKMKERPFSQKVNLGDDPINNTIMGLDFRYADDVPFLTRALDKMPLYSTNEMSNIAISGEVAHLRPGHNKFVGQGDEAAVYIDDFENSSSSYDLKGSVQTWRLASTPQGARDGSGNILFPEATLNSDIDYGVNRAKMSWYQLDQSFFRQTSSPSEVYDDVQLRTNHYVRPIFPSELFPNQVIPIQTQLNTFDITYTPNKRGPYNYERKASGELGLSSGLFPNGDLINPESRWGGIMRGIDNNNFEVANIEYIEFWMMDPFIYNDNSRGGDLYLNLGTISEDILKDSRMQYEHGLTTDASLLNPTIWGQVPKAQPIVNSFDNDAALRSVQDVGFDGLDDISESIHYESFLNDVQAAVDPATFTALQADPSSDNFRHYLDDDLDGLAEIIARYTDYNNPHGNSPLLTGGVTLSGSNSPDQEDMNRDNSLNENEEYFQYLVEMYPGMNVENHPYIISENEGAPNLGTSGGNQPDFRWLQFRIPIREYDSKVGNIQDFRSIQFMRMFLTDWEDSTTLRFGTLELIRNQWRTYQFELSAPSDNIPIDEDGTFFNVTQVNIEENSTKEPVNYVLPPGIVREQSVASNANQLVPQNEQSLAANVCDLKDGDARAIFKTRELDFRNYKRIVMDIHANRFPGELAIQDGSVTAFMRIGIDFRDNFYEYEVPLTITPDNSNYDSESDVDREIVWPEENKIDLQLQELVEAKKARNAEEWPTNIPYKFTTDDGRIITVKGTPDLGGVQVLMLGLRNPKQNDISNPLPDDDGMSKCVEVWFNEMRLLGFDEEAGSAAQANVAIKLADLGNVNFSTQIHSIGYGQVDMQVDERFQDKQVGYDFATNLNLEKILLPENANIRIPFYGSYSQTFSTPEFDPYQYDITSEDQIEALKVFSEDSALQYKRQIQSIETRKGFNFTNVRKLPGENQDRLYIFSPENLGASYSYNVIEFTDPFIESDKEITHNASLDYNHSLQPKYLYPFKKMIKGKSKYLNIIKETNFNFFPSTIGFNTNFNRQFGELSLRQLDGDDFNLPTTFNKFFTWNRNYTFRYNPFKSLKLDYTAANMARIDEPTGRIDTEEEKSEIWNNIKSGGRTTTYSQTFGASYTVPLNKIPVLDFTNTTINYNSGYNWIAAPLSSDENGNFIPNTLGNIMTNNQQLRVNSNFNLEKWYNKVPYLKKFNSRNQTAGNKEATQKKRESILKAREKIETDIEKLKVKKQKEKDRIETIAANENLDEEQKKSQTETAKTNIKNLKRQIKKRKKDFKKKQAPATLPMNLLVQPLVSVKKVGISYTENRATTLPGYNPDTDFFGTDRQNANAPGYGFVFGGQPGFKWFDGFDNDRRQEWLGAAADKGWISSDTLLNQKFTQSYTKNLNVTGTVEPFRDLKIDLTLNKTFTENHSEFYKKFESNLDWESRLPQDFGSYTVSAITWKTTFVKYDSTWLNSTYEALVDNREIISARLQAENGNSSGIYFNPSDTTGTGFNPNYAEGYGPTSQDVLIPAFLAAYQKKDAAKIKLNPFKTVPKPNWSITYNGLTKFKWAQNVFSSFSIRHGYSSTIQVNSFQTNYDNVGGEAPSVVDSLNGNYYSQFNIPSLIINEQLNPLIGFDMTFKNGVQARIDYRKSKTATMNFTDFQLIENNSTTITAGVGYRVKGLQLPFKSKKSNGKRIILHNDLNMRFDFSLRDNVIVNHLLDQGVSRPTSGSRVITVSPSIDYVINKSLNIRIFVDRNRTVPKTTQSFPTKTTRAGVTLRFSLANL